MISNRIIWYDIGEQEELRRGEAGPKGSGVEELGRKEVKAGGG